MEIVIWRFKIVILENTMDSWLWLWSLVFVYMFNESFLVLAANADVPSVSTAWLDVRVTLFKFTELYAVKPVDKRRL